MTWEAWVAVCAAVVALCSLLLVALLWLRQRELRRRIESPRSGRGARELRLARDVEASGQLVAFVANPSKPDVLALRASVHTARAEHGGAGGAGGPGSRGAAVVRRGVRDPGGGADAEGGRPGGRRRRRDRWG